MCQKCNATKLLSVCCGASIVDGKRCSVCNKFCKKKECKFCSTPALIDTPNYGFMLYNHFKGVTFNDVDHSYYYEGMKLQSVTQKLKTIQQPFEKEYWLKYCTLRDSGTKVQPIGYPYIKVNGLKKHYKNINIDVSVLEKEWEEKGEKGRKRGTLIHQYVENAFKGKYYTRRSKVLDSFVEDHDYLIPISLEQVVSDFKGIAGQVDGIFYNMELDRVEIYDHKSDKVIETKGYGKMKPPFEQLDDCNWNKYCLQLNMYRELIKPVIPIKMMYIIHFTDTEYEKYEVPYIEVKHFIDNDTKRRTFNTKKLPQGDNR